MQKSVALETEGDEVIPEVSASLRAELEVVELKAVLACSSARLTLCVVAIQDRLSNTFWDGLGVFTDKVVRVVVQPLSARTDAYVPLLSSCPRGDRRQNDQETHR